MGVGAVIHSVGSGSGGPGGIFDSLPGGENDPFFGGAAKSDFERNQELQRAEYERGRAHNIKRFGEAEERLSPWMDAEAVARESLAGELGLGPTEFTGEDYKNTPGYNNMLESSRRAVDQSAASYGGTSDRRMEAAAAPSAAADASYYTNYMNMLSNMASPTTSTNVGSLGVGQAATLGAQGGGVYGSMASHALNANIGQQNQFRDVLGAGMTAYGNSMGGNNQRNSNSDPGGGF